VYTSSCSVFYQALPPMIVANGRERTPRRIHQQAHTECQVREGKNSRVIRYGAPTLLLNLFLRVKSKIRDQFYQIRRTLSNSVPPNTRFFLLTLSKPNVPCPRENDYARHRRSAGSHSASVLARHRINVTILEGAKSPRYHMESCPLHLPTTSKVMAHGFVKKPGASFNCVGTFRALACHLVNYTIVHLISA
jgi:hypothetical protein